MVLLGACVVLYGMWDSRGERIDTLSANQSVLLDSARSYQVRDSLSALSIGVLRLEVGELQSARVRDVELIRDMGIRLRRAQSVAKVFTASKYEVISVGYGHKWNYRSDYIKLMAQRSGDTLRADITIYDTIAQVLHRVPRFKFLGIWFGTKGVRQEVVSRNPHTRIVAAEYIEIE